MHLDARIPVHVVPSSTPLPPADPQAVLVVAGLSSQAHSAAAEASGWMAVQHLAEGLTARIARHPAGCACCTARDPLALLLSSLFERRARGTLGLFRRVWLTTSPALAEAVPARLAADPVVAGRYRIREN